MPLTHPLLPVLEAAARGQFPPGDGGCQVLAPNVDGMWAVVGLTGRSYVLTDLPTAEVEARVTDGDDRGGFGAALAPNVLVWLAAQRGGFEMGSLDVVLVADLDARRAGRRAPSDIDELTPGDERWSHGRVQRAMHHRRHVRVLGDDAGIVCVGHGLADRIEISVERTDDGRLGGGRGRRLIEAGLDLVAGAGPSQWCWAQVAPGNAQSLRAFLAAGFRPIGSEQLLVPDDQQQ